MTFMCILHSSAGKQCFKHAKADPGPAHRRLFRNFWRVVFVNFNCIICIYFNCSHHTMFTIFTLFSTLTTKHRLRVKGASKQTPDPNNSTMPRLRSPVLKFLDSPLTSMFQKKISMWIWNYQLVHRLMYAFF